MLILAYFFNAGNLKSTQFFTLIFSWIFSTSKKIVDFRFPARLIDAVTCTEILHLRTPYFHYGRAPRPRALSRWNFACFSLLSALFFFLFCSERGSDLHERGKTYWFAKFFSIEAVVAYHFRDTQVCIDSSSRYLGVHWTEFHFAIKDLVWGAGQI